MIDALASRLAGSRIYPLIRPFVDSLRRRNFWKIKASDDRARNFYGQFIHPGDLVFDVGANIGERSKAFLALGARVVAFEPQRHCVEYLNNVMEDQDHFMLIAKALGRQEGSAELLVSDTSTVSTLAADWIGDTRRSGRFARVQWNEVETVEITTLDNVIATLGVPTFIKIDVEGYEPEVLAGLTRPIRWISIEFAAEQIEKTYSCVNYLASLSSTEFQFSQGESMVFDLPHAVSGDELCESLARLVKVNNLAWGDVYIRCLDL